MIENIELNKFRFGECLNYIQPTNYIVKSTEYSDKYDVPVLTPGLSFLLGYTNEKRTYKCSKEKPIILFDDFTGAFQWVDFDFMVKSSACKILVPVDDKVCLKYVYFYMQYLNYYSSEHTRLWISKYSNFMINLPSFEDQLKLVNILTKFENIIVLLQQELELRKKVYSYINNLEIYNFKSKKIRLGDLCEVITKGTTPKTYANYGVNFIKTESFVNGKVDKSKLSYITEEIHESELKRSILKEKDILLTIAGNSVGKNTIVTSDLLPANTNQALAIIRLNKDNIENVDYVSNIINSSIMEKYISTCVKGSAQPNLNLRQVNDFTFPMISCEDKSKYVKLMNAYKLCIENLEKEIELRQKQFEYYRDKLLNFEEE